VGNLIGPQTFRASDAPTYAPALATIVGCNVAVLLCMVAIRMVYTRRNAKVDESAPQAEDMTDR
jgi:ACS family allantoate permease-like MFS transporter